MKSIYLCGNISGKSYKEANGWREEVTRAVGEKYEILKPLEQQKVSKLVGKIDFRNPIQPLSPAAIVASDLALVRKADIVLCRMSDWSFGSIFELGYAWRGERYTGSCKLILVLEGGMKEFASHPFIAGTSLVFFSLEEAIEELDAI